MVVTCQDLISSVAESCQAFSCCHPASRRLHRLQRLFANAAPEQWRWARLNREGQVVDIGRTFGATFCFKWIFWLILAASFLILNCLSFWSPPHATATGSTSCRDRFFAQHSHSRWRSRGVQVLKGAGIILPSYMGVLISHEIRIPRKNIQDFMECQPRVCFTLHIFPSTYPSVLKHLGASCPPDVFSFWQFTKHLTKKQEVSF